MQENQHSNQQFQSDKKLILPPVTGRFRQFTESVLQDRLVTLARESVHKEFQGKFRKLPKGLDGLASPFVVHLEEVAQTLATFGYSAIVVAAGYTHDNIEDLQKQGWSKQRLADEFGHEVAELVDWVTQQNKTLPWIERQRLYTERLWQAPLEAVAISVADKISNLEGLIFWMQRGYRVEQIISKGWQENSDKAHALSQLYNKRLPGKLSRLFDRTLRQFDRLGKHSK